MSKIILGIGLFLWVIAGVMNSGKDIKVTIATCLLAVANWLLLAR